MSENEPMTILVGSKNPVKAASVEQAFAQFYSNVNVIGISVSSDVPDQPIGDDTLKGAQVRARNLLKDHAQDHGAQYCVGVEGGMIQQSGAWFSLGGVCILDVDGREGVGFSSWVPLSDGIVESVFSGKELGLVIDELSGGKNTKQQGGAVGFLTDGVIDRTALYVQGVTMAFIPFLNSELFHR
jgi:inosine/xanthosine triphosphatase